jgi:hypothetical protein
MNAQMKAFASIRYDRQVYVCGAEKGLSGQLAQLVGRRIVNVADPMVVKHVRWYLKESWEPSQLRECLENVTDFVMLLDDSLLEAVREAPSELATPDPPRGQELVVVLKQRDAHAAAGLDGEPPRVWLAKAQMVRLFSLRCIAGNKNWDLYAEDEQGRLHWFYAANEKVLKSSLEDGEFFGEDETRLSQQVEQFADHKSSACKHCGALHG